MSKQPKPDSKKYTDLIFEKEKGHIKIPKFQRDFVWSIDKTAHYIVRNLIITFVLCNKRYFYREALI